MDGTSNNIHIRAYSSDGYEITVILPGIALVDVAQKLAEVRAAGYLAARPEVAKLPITIISAGWSLEEVRSFVARWKEDDLTEADLIKALNITRWSEWTKTRAEADEAVTAYIKANLAAEPATPRTQPPAKIDCPTHLLEPGDIIYKCVKDGHGPQESRFEVIKNWGQVGRDFRLVLRNLKTDKEDTFMWSNGEQTLCDGPKVRAYAADPAVCVPAKYNSRPMWDKQFAAPMS